MKILILPIAAVLLVAFVSPASANCWYHQKKDQTVQKPETEPYPGPNS